MSKRVQAVLEAAHGSEIPTAAAKRPVEVRVFAGSDLTNLTVCGDELERSNVVAREPELTHEASLPSSERQARDAGVGSGTERGDEPGRLTLAIERGEQDTWLRPGHTFVPIECDLAHRRQIDHQPALAGRVPREAVAATLHGGQQGMRACELHGVHDVLAALAVGNERGMPIDRAIPYAPRPVVSGISGQKELSLEGRAKLLHLCRCERDRLPITRDGRH